LSKGGLEKLTRLRTIDASQNSLVSADIQILFKLSTLTTLTLDNNYIRSLEGVERLPNLSSLSARKNYIHTLTAPLSGGKQGEKGKGVMRHAPMLGKLQALHLSSNELREVDEVMDAVVSNSATSLEHLSIDRNAFGLRKEAARAARAGGARETGAARSSAVEALGVDLGAVLGDGNLPPADLAQAYKWTVLLRLPNIATLDGEEVLSHQREEAQHIHNHQTLQECITSAAQGYAETLHSLAKRKEWSVKALQTQQDQIQDVFTELKSKMQAEFRVTMKEVASTIKAEDRQRRRAGRRGAGGMITSDVVRRVEDMMEHVQVRQERHLHTYEEHVPLTRMAAAAPVHN